LFNFQAYAALRQGGGNTKYQIWTTTKILLQKLIENFRKFEKGDSHKA
jgi:hypothetical protein